MRGFLLTFRTFWWASNACLDRSLIPLQTRLHSEQVTLSYFFRLSPLCADLTCLLRPFFVLHSKLQSEHLTFTFANFISGFWTQLWAFLLWSTKALALSLTKVHSEHLSTASLFEIKLPMEISSHVQISWSEKNLSVQTDGRTFFVFTIPGAYVFERNIKSKIMRPSQELKWTRIFFAQE